MSKYWVVTCVPDLWQPNQGAPQKEEDAHWEKKAVRLIDGRGIIAVFGHIWILVHFSREWIDEV